MYSRGMDTAQSHSEEGGARTSAQRLVLSVLEPAEGRAKDAVEVAALTGLTPRGAQTVLYHLHDADLVAADEWGYYLPANA